MNTRKKLTADAQKLIFIMVGLPGRGKSYISRKLTAFLCWRGYKAQIFNVGRYRRETPQGHGAKADYFDPSNSSAVASREKAAMDALEDLFAFLGR